MVLRLLVGIRFQVLFTPLPRFFSPFPHGTSSIGRSVVFRLGWWSTLLPTGFLVPRGTLDSSHSVVLSRTRVSLSSPRFPKRFRWDDFRLWRSATPRTRRSSVWARPFSLAATRGFSVDSSSSGYLDVSVRRVWPPFRDDGTPPAGLPHSDIHGSLPACRSPWLFAACHVLLRL